MKTSHLLVLLIIVALIALPARYSYFDIDVQHPFKALVGFLIIIVGVIIVFIIDMRSQNS